MKRVVIGTAGHVDHGKTTLIKALTGVDCDRLKEEKRRGLTIELGFAALDLPLLGRVGVVDVPGHVRFIHHMLSGASGIDLVLLVVAADEGVMPQTVEHVQICELLGIRQGVVALTKTDMVDDDLRALALSDVREYLAGTFLKDAPVVPVSAVSGQGLPELVRILAQTVDLVGERRTGGLALLPIDRVFSVRGFGTVVTGTLASGQLRPGQDVTLLPGGRTGRIRNLQVHDRDVTEAVAGMRTAINLQGLAVEDIARGQWLTATGTFKPTRVVDARVDLLTEPGRGPFRLHTGTAEVRARMNLHETDGIRVARIRLDDEIVAFRGERFILRGGSPVRTIGGGTVLNPCPVRRFSPAVMRDLLAPEPEAHLRGMINDAGLAGIGRQALLTMLSGVDDHYVRALDNLLARGAILRFDSRGDLLVSAELAGRIRNLIAARVQAFHAENPRTPGIPREELRSGIRADLDPRLFHRIITEMVKARELAEEGACLRLEGFRAALARGEDYLGDRIGEMLRQSGFEPPRPQELAAALEIDAQSLDQILGFLVRQGRIVRVDGEIYLDGQIFADLKRRIRDFITVRGQMSPTDMKDICGVTRKYAIPYMEYLDRCRFTERVGNFRKLGSRA